MTGRQFRIAVFVGVAILAVTVIALSLPDALAGSVGSARSIRSFLGLLAMAILFSGASTWRIRAVGVAAGGAGALLGTYLVLGAPGMASVDKVVEAIGVTVIALFAVALVLDYGRFFRR